MLCESSFSPLSFLRRMKGRNLLSSYLLSSSVKFLFPPAMASGVWTILPLRLILLAPLPIRSTPNQSVQIFSRYSTVSGANLRDSSSNPHFQQISITGLLLRYGFPQYQLHEFIRRNRFLIKFSPHDVEKCIQIILTFGLNQDSMISILTSCPRVLELGFLRKWQERFLELGLQNLTPSFIQRALEHSAKIQNELNDLYHGVQVMKDLNFSDKTISRVLDEVPLITIKDPFHIGHKVDVLKGIGLNSDEIKRICDLFPGLFALNLDGRFRPLFGDLQYLNFRADEVRKVLLHNPKSLFSMEIGELSRCLELLNSLKCRAPIKKRILSNGQLRACIKLKLRVDCLCLHGLIHRDAFKVLFVEPRAIIYDLEDTEKKIDFLLCKLGLCIEHLVEFPNYLGLNLEKQIIPRFSVIECLRSKGGLGIDVGLKHLVRFSRLKFYNLFVKPYPECEKIFEEFIREAKPRHPTGLWKLLKPQKFSDTEEDVRNMKLFMKPLP